MKTYTRQRSGMAMFAAIAFLLIMATIMGLMVSMTTLTTKRGVDIYFQEQAHLLAKSATEFAMLAISGYTRSPANGCINDIHSSYMTDVYEVNTSIRYIGLGGICDASNSYIDDIVTPESNGTVLIDVYVTIPSDKSGAEPVRFHRRTIQKP